MQWLSCSSPSGGFNPYDAAWQKSRDFPSDKEKEWEGKPLSRDFWWMWRNSLRSGLKDMQAAIRAVSGRFELEQWQADVIKGAWARHKELISSSLRNQSDVVMPFLAERINMDGRMKESHLEIRQAAAGLDVQMKSLKASRSKEFLQGIQNSFGEYQNKVLRYLEDDENTNLPLMHAYFTPAEARKVVQKLLNLMSPAEMGSLIFYTGEESWFEFMAEESGLSCFSWICSLKSKRDDFEINYVQPLAFVTRGVPLASTSFIQCSLW